MSSSLLQTLVIPEYIKEVKLSNKQRPKYYKKEDHDKLPNKYKTGRYKYDSEGRLFDVLEEQHVIKNKKSVGKPKIITISGNDVISGYSTPMIRDKIVKVLKDHYRIYVQQQLKPFKNDNFPLRVEWFLHTVPGHYDMSNLFLYNKYLEDSLTETYDPVGKKELVPIIPDDNLKYITIPAAPIFVPVNTLSERKFVFNFYKDDREEIINHPFFQTIS